MELKRIIIGSRDSKLAIAQTQLVMKEIHKYNPQLHLEMVTMKTTGDMILDTSLDKIGGKGLFVKELDKALIDGRIHIAVNSLKDMPMEENPDIPVAVMYKRGDPRDVLVFPKEHILNKNINNYRVGSSSRRRELQLKMLYPGIHIESIRGNIITRLNKLDSGEYDALVLAASGLDRVNMADRISRYFSVDEMLPAAGQGILAIQARKDLNTGFLKLINDESAVYAAAAERSFVAALDGGCSSPVAAHAVIMDDELTLTGLYYDEKTKNSSIASISGSKSDAHELGIKLAGRMRK